MMTTWYVSIEWQLTIFIAPMLIYLLSKHEKLGLAFIVSLIAAIPISVGIWSYIRRDVFSDFVM